MSTLALPDSRASLPTGGTKWWPLSPWQVWGLILVAPYVLIFLVFVLDAIFAVFFSSIGWI